MDELEIMKFHYALMLHGIKFKVLIQAVYNINPELFKEYEKLFREEELINQELKIILQKIKDMEASQN